MSTCYLLSLHFVISATNLSINDNANASQQEMCMQSLLDTLPLQMCIPSKIIIIKNLSLPTIVVPAKHNKQYSIVIIGVKSTDYENRINISVYNNKIYQELKYNNLHYILRFMVTIRSASTESIMPLRRYSCDGDVKASLPTSARLPRIIRLVTAGSLNK